MELTQTERSMVAINSMGSGDVNVAGVKMRPLSMGSLLQLQRVGNPYGLLATLEPDEEGRVDVWSAAEVTDQAEIYYYLCEAVYIHLEEDEKVENVITAFNASGRRVAVEKFMRQFAYKDSLAIVEAFKRDVLEVQSMMITPDSSSLEDEDPLGHGRTGHQQ